MWSVTITYTKLTWQTHPASRWKRKFSWQISKYLLSFPVFWQNFQIPLVFPDRDFFFGVISPVFPVQWGPWEVSLLDYILARRVPRSGGREILGLADISRRVDMPTEKPSFLTHPKIGSDGHVQNVEKKSNKALWRFVLHGWLSVHVRRKKETLFQYNNRDWIPILLLYWYHWHVGLICFFCDKLLWIKKFVCLWD